MVEDIKFKNQQSNPQSHQSVMEMSGEYPYVICACLMHVLHVHNPKQRDICVYTEMCSFC